MYELFFDNILFPLAPKTITTTLKNKNTTYDLINSKEYNMAIIPGLTTYEFELLLPNVPYPFAKYVANPELSKLSNNNNDKLFYEADVYIKKLMDMKQKVIPFIFSLYRYDPLRKNIFDTVDTVVIEDLKMMDDYQEGMDIVIKISLKSFNEKKPVEIIERSQRLILHELSDLFGEDLNTPEILEEPITVMEVATERFGTPVEIPTEIISKAGDTLQKLAQQIYGDANRWIDIFNANYEVITKQANDLGLNRFMLVPNIRLSLPFLPVAVKNYLEMF